MPETMSDRIRRSRSPWDVADAVRVLVDLAIEELGEGATGPIQIHLRDGRFQVLQLPSRTLGPDDLNLSC